MEVSLIDQIRSLESASKSLEPTAEERKRLLAILTDYTQTYYAGNEAYPPFVDERPEKLKMDLEPQADFQEIIGLIQSEIEPYGLRATSPSHVAYFPAGGLFHSALGDYLVDISNVYTGLKHVCPGARDMEDAIIHWVAKDLVGYKSKEPFGVLLSGGSITNLTALSAAKQKVCEAYQQSHGLKEPIAKTFFRIAEKLVIYVSSQTHHCIQKAVRLMGMHDNLLGEEGNIHYVDMHADYTMDSASLQAAIEEDKTAGKIPWLIVGSAGTTSTGAVDNLEALATVSEQHDCWLHVDAAYGGFFLLTEFGKKLMKGIERADSVSMDAHKTIFIPYGLAILVVKDKEFLYRSFEYHPDYYVVDDYDKYSPANLSPELTRHFRGMRMWLPLKMLGVEAFGAAIEEKRLLAHYCYQQMQKMEDIELLDPPPLSTFAFRLKPKGLSTRELNQLNAHFLNTLNNTGKTFVSKAEIPREGEEEKVFFIRISVMSVFTHLKHVQGILELIRTVKAGLLADSAKFSKSLSD